MNRNLVPNRGIRIEDSLYLKLKVLAQKDSRSFNNYLVKLLGEHVEAYEREHGEIKVDTDELYK